MSFKSKLLAAASVLALAGGLGTVSAATATAATPSCGPICPDIFSREFGTHHTPNFVLDVFQGGASVGKPIILWRTSNSDVAEDFTADFTGTTTADFYAAGLVSSAVALHYGCVANQPNQPGNFPNCGFNGTDDPATEIEYSPAGIGSGLCVGLAATAHQNEGVTLQPCGESAKTVWILDINDSPSTVTHGYIPLINGSDTNFSHPYVLDYPHNSFPTDRPRAQLIVTRLTGFSQGNLPLGTPVANVIDSQLWGADFGILR